jgi:tRNA (guanine37-N1)-methyltransferase
MNHHPTYDLVGNIAIVKFDKFDSEEYKKRWAKDFLAINPHMKTILEKKDRVKGRLRIAKTKFIAGEDTKETVYTENGCRFKLNVDETYFSPRLSNERALLAQELAKKITKTKDKVLVMFAGIAPFPVVISKVLKQKNKKAAIVSNELNRKACKYAEENVVLNKLEDYIKVIQCDAKKLPEKLKTAGLPEKYDFIMMARPNLKDTFLKTALKLSKKGTLIHYHGFGTEESVLEEIKKDAGKKIGKIKMRKAGDIAPREFRWDAKFSVK